jgi:aquaporin Z
LIGLAMALTAIGIIYSPWGKRSGAHLNPAVTLTFLRLGKISRSDAIDYILAQFIGGALGVVLVWVVLSDSFARPPVEYVATKPGAAGLLVSWLTEFGMSVGLMLTVLVFIAQERLMRFTGLAAGVFVATYIAVLAPLSGMSINPARTFVSALPGQLWDHLWIYFTAPVMGMLLAAEALRLFRLGHAHLCAKLNHDPRYRCIHCGYQPRRPAAMAAGGEQGHSCGQED